VGAILAVVHVQDFVTLQKWDHHGTYDLKLLIERSHRKLANCGRKAASAAGALITPILAKLANSFGMELIKQLVISMAKDEGKPPSAVKIPAAAVTARMPVDTTVQLFSLWRDVAQLPASVCEWLAAACAAIKEGVDLCLRMPDAQLKHARSIHDGLMMITLLHLTDLREKQTLESR
jgi:hypothetical protein